MENQIMLMRKTVLTAIYVLVIVSVLMLIRSNNKQLFEKQKNNTTVQKTGM